MESLPPDDLVPYPSEDIEYTEFRSEKIIQKVRDEISIFEICQKSEVDGNAENKNRVPALFCLMEPFPRKKVIDYHKEKEEQEETACLVIEKEACSEEKGVSQKYLGMDKRENSKY